jgi:STE24 endopeptidase
VSDVAVVRSSVARGPVLVATTLAGLLLIAGAWAWIPWQPVPGGVTPVPAGDLFSADQLSRAETYSSSARVPGLSSLALSLSTLILLALHPGVRRTTRAASERRTGWVVVPAIVLAVHGVVWVVTLPLGLWGRAIRVDYGLTTQGLAPWFADRLLGEGIRALVDLLLAATLIASLRWAGRWWPVVAGGVVSALVVVGSFAYPVLVEPLFNDFDSLSVGDLRDRILALAAEEGVDVEDVLVADASRRTTMLNAYVSGFGDTRRVVLYDTALEGLSDDELLVVVAHELSHARHNDVGRGTALAGLAVFLALCLFGLVFPGLVSSERRRSGRSDHGWIPAFLALSAVVGLLALPVQNLASRAVELRADVDSLAATADPASFVAVHRALAVRSLADPTPPRLLAWWFGSHPDVLTRVALAERP